MKNRAIVFAPHPDDETLGCGGTIAKKVSEEYDVFVVFMTDARYSLTEVGITSGPSPSKIRKIRREEAVRAARTLGLQERNLFFMDFEDKTLKMRERDVENRIVEIMKELSPAEIYFPQEKEYHIDHRITNLVARNAVKRSNLHPIEYQYAIAWSFPYYLPVHILNERTFDLLMSKILKLDLIHIDISRFLHIKSRAFEEYRSQLVALSYKQRREVIKRSFLKRFLKREERFFCQPIIG